MKQPSKLPPGLFYLVFTEFWERFGYYLMIGIFLLYMITDPSEGGWGWDNADASDVLGTFMAFVYLTPFVGGLLADMRLGYRLSITLGGILMGMGYCMLAIHELWAFYTAIALMIVGNGFFKPNITTILGNLYNAPEYKAKKDTGYNIFYMGINAGALICNFIAAIMRNKIGWHGAFITAGIGMFVGVIVFWLGNKHYKHVDVRREIKAEDKPVITRFLWVLLVAILFGLVGWAIPGNIMGSDSTDGFFMACIPVIYFYASVYFKAKPEEKRPLGTMYTIFLIVIMFWAVFKQNASALTLYAEYYTDREVPTALAPAAKTLSLSVTLFYQKKEVNLLGEQFRKLKDEKGKSLKGQDYPAYFKNMEPTSRPAEGGQLNLFNSELFQSINPFFVVFLTPLIVAFFAFLRRRKMEPTTATKIAYGLLISALSTFVMVGAVYYTGNGAVKASAWWLAAGYGVITIGELLLSPMGLSMVSKLSPLHLTALMMGGWSLATAIGNKLSAVLAKNWDRFDNKANYFYLNFALLMVAAIIMFSLLKKLNKVFKEG